MSGPPREVEGALLAGTEDPDELEGRLAGIGEVGGYRLLPRPPLAIRDVYLDTAGGELGARRVALRLRRVDGAPLLTLKADARRTGLAAERLEIEAPWSAEALLAALAELGRRGVRLPDPPPEQAADPLTVAEALGLLAVQDRETRRTPRDVVAEAEAGPAGRAAGPVAELAVDAVAYRFGAGADRRTVRLLEVEVEAKGAGGVEVVQRVLEALANAFPSELRPWPYGKLQTGRAVGRLLDAGRLDGLLDPAGNLRPAAHDLLAGILSRNSS